LLVIFCEDPLRAGTPDQAFEAEAQMVQSLGIDHGLIGYEALVNERRPARAVRRLAGAEPPRDAIYRGWMLRPSEYAALYDALMAKGIRLLNSPAAYIHCHYLPESYHVIADRTAKSVWMPLSDGFSMDAVMALLKAFGPGPVIVKDYVKSQKHYWHEACFIPSAADVRAVERVVRRFLELQGDSLNEGLVFREFVAFEPSAEHSRSGMPMTREFRMFVRDGDVRCCAPYWGEGRYEGAVPSADEFSDVTRRVQSRFFSMDVARQRDGAWMIVELGDGQIAGLPPSVSALEFYRMLEAGTPAPM
jgi:ATP-grasp domain-containing protein